MHQLPVELTFEAAIALIGSGRTALAALDLAGVTGDDIVIVPGAAGGLGNLLVQGASAFGATVIALVTGTTKAAAIADFGATVLDTDKPNWSAELSNLMAANPATVLLDGVGGPVARVAFEALGSGARVVPFGWSSGSGLSFDTQDLMSRAITVSAGLGPAIMSRPGYLRELETRALAAGAAGSIRPLVHEFALADAAEAHRAIENRRAIGKVVLRVW